MKAVLAVSLLTLLTGCAGLAPVPLKHDFPDAPPILMEKAPGQSTLPKDAKLSTVVTRSIENMGKYHELEAKYNAWQKWYDEQKKIFDLSQKKYE